MFTRRILRRLAGAALAASLAVGGAAVIDDTQPDAETEEAGAVWAFTGGGGKGFPGAGTQGATWS